MASINIMKLHGSEGASILAHAHRHDGKDVQYRNKHIDTARSKDNSTRYFKSVHDTAQTAHDEYARLKARVEEIDAKEPPKRIRRDRVTMVAFEVPVPEGLPADREEKFFSLAYREIASMCGGSANVSTMRIHRDEVHEYTDPLTKERRTSRVHAHVVGIPYVPGKGVNCKGFMSRQALRDLQKRLDDKCRQELGVAFMDGSRQRSRGTVEDLKRASARTEQELAERIASQEAILAELQSQTDEARAEAEKARSEAHRASIETERAQALLREAQSMDFDDQIELLRFRDWVRSLQKRYPEYWEQMERAEEQRKQRSPRGRDR